MALKTNVKAGNITNLSDARYCAGMGVDLLGFPVGTETETADLKLFSDIRSWVSGPATVLELKNAPGAEFLAALPSYNVDFLEINVHHLESLPPAIPLLVSLDLAEWTSVKSVLLNNRARIRYLVLTANQPLSKESIAAMADDFEILLKLNEGDTNVTHLLTLPIAGFALSGSPEERPGLKGYESLAEVLEQLETEN